MANNENFEKPANDKFGSAMQKALKCLKERFRKRQKEHPDLPKIDVHDEDTYFDDDREPELRFYRHPVLYAEYLLQEQENGLEDESQVDEPMTDQEDS